MEYTVDVLFNEWSNYKSEKFNLEDDQETINFIMLLYGNNMNITTKCIKDDKEYAFNMQHIKHKFYLVDVHDGRESLTFNGHHINLDKATYRIYNLEYLFTCTKNSSHIYTMYITVIQRKNIFEVIKVGQYPDKEDIQGFDFDIYKKVLEKYDIYNDYKSAYICYCHDFSVASYAYIRRVFEKILIAFVKLKKEKTKTEPKDNRSESKIEFASDIFCEDIRGLLKMLYGVLSKGIHELSEQDCKKYYGTLKAIIEMQLAYMEAERQKEEKKNSLSKQLHEIHSELKRETP